MDFKDIENKRKALKISQTELAEKLGISQRVVSALETNNMRASETVDLWDETLDAIAKERIENAAKQTAAQREAV